MKNIILIAGSVNTKDFLIRQLREFISDKHVLEAYSEEEGIKENIKCDLLIISSQDMKDDLDLVNMAIEYKEIVVCERSVNFDFIDKVAGLPVNEEVLLVNDEKETVYSTINDLKELGLNHIKYYPYYPGIHSYKKIKTAITPGETDKVPACVTNMIDIGPRIISINSMYLIMNELDIDQKDTAFITKKYMQKIVNVSKHVSAINNKVNALNGYLNDIIHNLVNGILVYDEDGYIKYANEKIRKFLLTEKELENRNIRNFIDRELYPYFLSSDTFENKVLNMMGVNIKITKFTVPNSTDIVILTDANKNDVSNRTNITDYLLKGHVAKYNIENIIGSSSILNDAKKTALKLAKTDLTVLIEGESGTGKELFASAIHQNSKRKYGPYLAINFSALPDDLIESELFGYEEGAFTGARKGGKIGLFELADGGTIFLDEIGDISLKVQTRLLRVLQEKEFMMVGGTSIKRLDVRIIAATNKNLRNMVIEKKFRSDLYYRLKIGYLYIPPLRARIMDIEELAAYFIKISTAADIKVSQKVIDEFMKYKWFGNVRELENTIQYMLAVRNGNTLAISDLPDRNFFEKVLVEENNSETNNGEKLNDDLVSILKCIKELQDNNMAAGREKISYRLKEYGCSMTSSQVRTRLDTLENKGYLIKKRGKQGTVLTDLGLRYIKSIEGQ